MRKLETSIKHLKGLTLQATHHLPGGPVYRWVGGKQPRIEPVDIENVVYAAEEKIRFEQMYNDAARRLALAASTVLALHDQTPAKVTLNREQRDYLITAAIDLHEDLYREDY